MPSALTIFLISALLCVAMLLVLSSLLRSGIAGVKHWTIANLLACGAFILYAFGRELPPLIAYEVANGVYAAASAAMLVGFRRFFGRRAYRVVLGAGVLLLTLTIALFHYQFDSFAGRTVTVSVFQAIIGIAIAVTVLRSPKAGWRSRYPYLFTQAMGVTVALGHTVRAVIYVAHPGELTSLLQPSPWNLFFVSAGSMALPALTLGAVMIVHDVMLGRAEHAANRDFLTGAWSRRALFEFAQLEITRAQRTRRNLCLMVFDIDHFKTINDRLGHAAGDRVLVEVVARAGAAIRNVDYLGRIGGEEFAVLLPETDLQDALVVAERLRSGLQRLGIDHADEPAAGNIDYTVSVGVAMLRENEAFHDLMGRADAALYQAKLGGRNRVVAASV